RQRRGGVRSPEARGHGGVRRSAQEPARRVAAAGRHPASQTRRPARGEKGAGSQDAQGAKGRVHSMKRLLLVVMLCLLASPAFADWQVTNGSYTQTIRGTTVSGAQVQDINVADPTTGTRVNVGASPGTNGITAMIGNIPHFICDSGCSSSSSPSFG